MNRFAKEIGLDRVVLKQLLNQSEFEGNYLTCAQRTIENEVTAVLLLWQKELIENNYLSALKSLHYFLGRIRSIYSNCLSVFEKSVGNISSTVVSEIVEGAIKMLKNGLNDMPAEAENVIEQEDIRQISIALEEMKSSLETVIGKVLKESNANDFLILGDHNILTKLLNKVEQSTIETMRRKQHDVLIHLNQLDNRPELKRYCHAIDEIVQAIAPLQSIQVEIIVEMVEDKKEIQILTSVLQVIQDIYKKTIREQETTQNVLRRAVISGGFSDQLFQTFTGEITLLEELGNNIDLSTIIQQYLNRKKDITEKLYAQLSDEIGKAYMFSVRDLKNQSKEIQLLSCQIIEAIKSTAYKLSRLNLEEVSRSAEELLKRIFESIGIKHESLKDKNFEYIIHKRDQYLMQNKQLFDFKEKFLDKFEENFEKMLVDSTRHMLAAQEDFNKLVNRLEDQCLKMDMEFLKNDLLFEVVTFEEIITHSLPKLQIYDEEAVLLALDQINELHAKIEKVIHQAGIGSITPHNHQKFNGKEHEVIMVEERVGFNKGEIIQAQTKGYIFHGVILMRANVIVAK